MGVGPLDFEVKAISCLPRAEILHMSCIHQRRLDAHDNQECINLQSAPESPRGDRAFAQSELAPRARVLAENRQAVLWALSQKTGPQDPHSGRDSHNQPPPMCVVSMCFSGVPSNQPQKGGDVKKRHLHIKTALQCSLFGSLCCRYRPPTPRFLRGQPSGSSHLSGLGCLSDAQGRLPNLRVSSYGQRTSVVVV